MKDINLFGFKFSFDIKRNSITDEERYSPPSILREKILYLIILMFIFAISSKISLIYNNNSYKLGDVVKSDVYAPKSILFRDDAAKEKIIQNMINESGKEYVFASDAESVFIGYFNGFFEDVKDVRNKYLKEIDIRSWERRLGKRIPSNLVNDLLALSSKNLLTLQASSEELLHKIYGGGIYEDKSNLSIKPEYETELEKLPSLNRAVVETFLAPNYIYDEESTKKSVYGKVSQIKDQFVEIPAGTLILKTGDILDERKLKLLESCDIFSFKKSVFYFAANILYLFLISVTFYIMSFTLFRKEILDKNKYRSIFIIIIVFFTVFRFFGSNYLYLIPADTALFLIVLITNGRMAMALFPLMLAYVLPMIDYNLIYFFLYIASFPIGSYLISKVTTRSGIISAGIKLAMLRVILFGLLSLFMDTSTSTILLDSFLIIISGLAAGTLTVAMIPYFERTFNILTVFKLLELGDLSNPLLKRLSVEAPGTFNHSMMVATLAENAARSIGVDPIFARVASYYHDIGKCKRPKFFVENQEGKENPHNGLSPFMSKTIIIAHTKNGVEMGREYGIPLEIRNIMLEHHGTTFLAYFYNLAKGLDQNVTEDEFRYPGPKPQSKESAVIMLSDTIEAAVRSLDKKTPKSMENTIRELINVKISDHQLSETPLTFKEIEIIVHSFLKSLSGIYHERLKYPGQKN